MGLTVITLTEVAAYTGPHALPGIRFRALRQALGVTAFGLNLLELDPGCESYPEHDHLAVMKDGQEEVYLVLEGSVVLQAEGTERVLAAGDAVRVPPDVTRKLVTRGEGATVLALGATPGRAYAPT